MKELTPFAIRRRFPDYETIEYDILAGMVVMELTESHFPLLLETSPELFIFRLPEKRINPVLVVTYIIPCSYVYQLNIINVGTVITHVNGDPVVTLEQWKRAIEKAKNKEFVSIVTNMGVLMVLSWHKIYENQRYLETLGIYSGD